MLKLEPLSTEPFWLDVLPGVRIQFRPVSVAAMLIARGAAGEALKAGGEQATIEAGAAFTRALAQTGIVAWEGIGDAKGKPVDPNKEAIKQLLELWPAFDAIDRLYVGPALTRLDEKKSDRPRGMALRRRRELLRRLSPASLREAGFNALWVGRPTGALCGLSL